MNASSVRQLPGLSKRFATQATIVGATADVDRLHRLIRAAHARHRDEQLGDGELQTTARGYACRRYEAHGARHEPSLAAVLWSEGRDPASDVCILLTSRDESDGHTFCLDRGTVVCLDGDAGPARARAELAHRHAAAAFDRWCLQRSIRLAGAMRAVFPVPRQVMAATAAACALAA